MTSNDETVMDRRCVEPRFLAGWAERTLSTLVLQKFLDAALARTLDRSTDAPQ
jgi:hypothetical protein